MARRYNHYEAAFEDYLRALGWPYVPVDDQKKALFAGARIKSFDFLVYRPRQTPWLVDIKGRKFPYEGRAGRRYWENWVTRADLNGLCRWEAVFGRGFVPGLVFAYWLRGGRDTEVGQAAHRYRTESYAFLWVSVRDYATYARPRSAKWDTLSVSRSTFRRLVEPIGRPWAAGGHHGERVQSTRGAESAIRADAPPTLAAPVLYHPPGEAYNPRHEQNVET